MARPLRVQFPGAVYHITARGNARQNIYAHDSDRWRFLHLLGREVQQQGWKCHAYCLMANHDHLLLETPAGNLVRGMRRLNGVYTQSYNRRHRRVGHLFQGRYQAIVVDRDRYLLELCRYGVLNPVSAEHDRPPGFSRSSTMPLRKKPQCRTEPGAARIEKKSNNYRSCSLSCRRRVGKRNVCSPQCDAAINPVGMGSLWAIKSSG